MSTRKATRGRAWRSGPEAGSGDPARDVALVAMARRAALLHAHRHRLRWEELEDCFSQATFELVVQARGGRVFHTRRHLENALRQRFLSRVHDRRRALAGRSPMQAAWEASAELGEGAERIEPHDVLTDPERVVLAREQLRRVRAATSRLTHDQRLVIAAELGDLNRAELCGALGWSAEKYRKVAQRGRARLRSLLAGEEGVTAATGASDSEAGTCP